MAAVPHIAVIKKDKICYHQRPLCANKRQSMLKIDRLKAAIHGMDYLPLPVRQTSEIERPQCIRKAVVGEAS
jgi:hypothetical protein